MRKIGMVLNAYYPDDIRIRKEANALMAKGFETVLICYKKRGELEEEFVGGIKVRRIIEVNNKLVKTFHDSWIAMTKVHLFFTAKLSRIVEEEKIEVLHIHDLPMANTGIKVARKFDIPVVLDLHENYPAMVDFNRQFQTRWIQKINFNIFYQYNAWFSYERKMVKRVNHILTVVQEMKDRLVKMHGIEANKIIIVGNEEEKEFWKKIDTREKEVSTILSKGKYNLLYVGGLGPHRGLDTAIKGIGLIKEEYPDMHLHIVGGGNYAQALKSLVENMGLNTFVTLHGKVPFDLVAPLMKRADLNLVPHNSTEHTEHTIPHKLYQIMMIKAPLLVSSCAPLKRVVSENNSGYIFEADSPEDFAKQVIYIYQNRDEALKVAEHAMQRTLYGDLNWENRSKPLLDLYNQLLKK